MHVVDARGRRWSGGAVLAPLAGRSPAARSLAPPSTPSPALADAAYGLVARNRGSSRSCCVPTTDDVRLPRWPVTVTLASAGPPSAPRQGSDRRALPRAPRRSRARARRAPLHRALQPRVPQGVRRNAAPVPAHPPARARGRAAPQHRPDRLGDLLHGRAQSVGSFTSSFGRAYGMLADRLPRRLSTGSRPGPDPDLHADRLRPAESSSFGEDSRLSRD